MGDMIEYMARKQKVEIKPGAVVTAENAEITIINLTPSGEIDQVAIHHIDM